MNIKEYAKSIKVALDLSRASGESELETIEYALKIYRDSILKDHVYKNAECELDIIRCPKCESTDIYGGGTDPFKCLDCKEQFTHALDY